MKTNGRSVQLNNKGFSLVELIIVIAIMVVLVAIALASSSILGSSYVKEVERGVVDYVSLTSTKSMSVSAKEWYMVLTKEDGEYVTKLCKTEEQTENGNTKLVTFDIDKEVYNGNVDVWFINGDTKNKIDDKSPLAIYFNASTGKVSKITIGTTEISLSSGIGRIQITSGDYERVLKLFYNTGKCEREE